MGERVAFKKKLRKNSHGNGKMSSLRCFLARAYSDARENGSLFKKKSSLLRNLGQQIGFAIKIANLLRKPQLVASAKTFAKLQDVVYM